MAKNFGENDTQSFSSRFQIRTVEQARSVQIYGRSSKTKMHPIGCIFVLEVTAGFEPADNGVADRGLTAWLRHHMIGGEGDPFRFLKKNGYELFVPVLERITGLEPATSTLARSRSTK